MKTPEPGFSVEVDLTNPGQFFACCGLLELAHRLWPGTEGWFEDKAFQIGAANCRTGFAALLACLSSAWLCSDDETADDKTCPLRLQLANDTTSPPAPLSLRLDWWLDDTGVGSALKTWAGQQRVTVMSRAMLHTAVSNGASSTGWLDRGAVAHDPESPRKVVEPFYFDARRYAHALDAGFSLDAIGAEAIAYPSVELMALIGLQRFRPRGSEGNRWMFEYFAWSQPMGVAAAAVACGAVPIAGRRGFRFRLQFRDDQKRYKAFGFATPIGGDA